jgi:acyl carrier protein
MMQTTIQDDVREFVIDNFLFGQDGDLADDESFLEKGVIDSTGVLELVGFLETCFAISVEDEDLVPANLDSVGRVTSFVQRKLKDKGSRLAG